MFIRQSIAGILLAITALSASAGPAADALKSCLADNTTGKERKELATWIFVAMAAHPELKDLSKITEIDRERTNQALGGTVTRLLAQSCLEQTRSALKIDGREAVKSAFALLGQLAMQELMSNPDVGVAFAGFERYVDRKKLEALMP